MGAMVAILMLLVCMSVPSMVSGASFVTEPNGVLATHACAQPIAIGGAYIYWANLCAQEIQRVAKSGGSVENVSTLGNFVTFTVGGLYPYHRFVYWTETVFSPVNGGELYSMVERARATGGSPQVLVNTTSGIDGLTVVGQEVFFCNSGMARIEEVPITGGSAMTLASVGCWQLTSSNGILYWYDWDNVGKVPISGGLPTTLTKFPFDDSAKTGVQNILVSNGVVYWTSDFGNSSGTFGAVRYVDASGGPLGTLYSISCKGISECVWGLGENGTDVIFSFFIDYTTASDGIYLVPNSGGAAAPILTGAGFLENDLKATASHVFYATGTGLGEILKTRV